MELNQPLAYPMPETEGEDGLLTSRIIGFAKLKYFLIMFRAGRTSKVIFRFNFIDSKVRFSRQ